MVVKQKRAAQQVVDDRDKRQRQENALDDALADTFPASDPVSTVQPTSSNRAKEPKER
jgi:hypothetical protein